ncbi:hypothetical protein V491_06648, partial [Pseudogymnoascus sp. VKM F-3775]
DSTAGDVVVGCHYQEDGFGVAHAVGHEPNIVDAAFKDLDLLIVNDFREQAVQLALVAAVGVDFVVRRLKKILYEGGAAVARAAEDGVGSHGHYDKDNDDEDDT